ncbi:MAG: PASTA domain-containing protein [Oscillospiraceae bacterium]|nr:PASTA domain-containing protein [Oscillospiraceae bacterium]
MSVNPYKYRPSNEMRYRLVAGAAAVVLALGGYVTFKISDAAVVKHDKYLAMANDNQFSSTTVKASRGSIYDANGKIMAQSATVYNVIISPGTITDNPKVDNAERDREVQELAKILSEELGEDLEMGVNDLIDCFYEEETKNRQWIRVARKIERPVIDKIKERANESKLTRNLFYTEQDTRRYYPQSTVASSVIGFTNYEGDGIYGVEAYYNEYLAGVDGKVISARDGSGNEMPYDESEIYQTRDGANVYMTINSSIQLKVEEELEKCIQQNDVRERATAIIMNAKTGAIIAMATVPTFDLNDRNSIYDTNSKRKLAEFAKENPDDKEGYDQMYSALRETQWKNKAVTEPYEPGSIFKIITGSAALEEEAIDLETKFYCDHSMIIADRTFNCWTAGAHGGQNFVQAMTNSCNPAFIQIGQFLGIDKFQQYYKAYGFTEPTGIDLPGEAQGLYVTRDQMGRVELASCSFGQSNAVTAIQMVTAAAAVVNGGYLLKPYVVEKVVDPNGNVMLTQDKTVRRQVISEETSATMRDVLESVVNGSGRGSNLYIKGYRIGGKTGTAQKLEKIRQTRKDDLYVSSYIAFAPADDPEIIMLCSVDEPMGYDARGKRVYYGSVVAAPVVQSVLKEILPELGFYTEYSEDELAVLDIAVPDVTGMSLEAAKEKLEEFGLSCDYYGRGQTISSQFPIKNSYIPRDGTVILYTEPMDTVMATVPDVKGCTVSDAKYYIQREGLNFKAGDGASAQSGSLAYAQTYEPGTEVPAGTVVEVTFLTSSEG